MTFWLLLTVNSVTFGGLLFLLSAGFSLIFGLMRIPNLTHGSMFMVGAYLGTTFFSGALGFTLNFWVGAVITALEVAVLGALMERRCGRPPARPPLGPGAGGAPRPAPWGGTLPDAPAGDPPPLCGH